jgi:SAM-dependent methyltransferase
MNLLDTIHGGLVHKRRVRILSDYLAEILLENGSVLDMGCGDGQLAFLVQSKRPDLTITGIDVLVRSTAAIPVMEFDGKHIPFPDGSFDVVTLIDVLHHAVDPMILLREAARVARIGLVIKDHLLQGVLASRTLRLMDWVANARHGVALYYNYWSPAQWFRAFDALGLRPKVWKDQLGLYPYPVNSLFERSWHFLTLLEKPRPFRDTGQ